MPICHGGPHIFSDQVWGGCELASETWLIRVATEAGSDFV